MTPVLDTLDIIKNLETIYDSDNSFRILKDYERVIDELGLYVYANWDEGELAKGPVIQRHWVSCTWMWDENKMPDPMGAKRLLDYDCKVKAAKGHILVPREIKTPDDFRPGTKKGKLDKKPVWFIEIRMPKKLIADMFGGAEALDKFEIENTELANSQAAPAMDQEAIPPSDMGGL